MDTKEINWAEEYIPSQAISVRVSREDYEQIKAICEQYSLTPSTVVRKIVHKYFIDTKGEK